MHVKRQKAQKSWPIPRKGTKYVIVTSHEKTKGIPILIILRNMLKLAKNRKEVKKILNQKSVALNGKAIHKDNQVAVPFDIISVGNKSYELKFTEKGKFDIAETSKKERVLKVTGKKILRNKKIQLNLLYGKSVLYQEKVKVGSSVVIKEGKIIKTIPFETGKTAVVLSGKHIGKEGEIKSIKDKIAVLNSQGKNINVPIKSLMAVK
jgi:small subunit ribosomal protein S4e